MVPPKEISARRHIQRLRIQGNCYQSLKKIIFNCLIEGVDRGAKVVISAR